MGVSSNQRILLPEACSRLQMTREQVIPRIQKGDLEGGQELGRWYVMLESIVSYLAKEAADSEGAA